MSFRTLLAAITGFLAAVGLGFFLGRWLQSQPATPNRDRAMQSMISQLAYQSPEIAAPWINAIADSQQRNSAIEQVAARWLQADRRAAEAWLAGTMLPDDRKQRLLGR